MKTTSSKKIILAIEASVAGGSLALFDAVTKLASRAGDADVSRAETLLPQIARMLNESHIEKTQLDMIAVSLGPGSFTGIRIGVATALGLKNALGIPCVGYSTLVSVANSFAHDGAFVVAVPVGKSDVAWQVFERDNTSSPVSDDANSFLEFLQSCNGLRLYAHSLLIERLGSELQDREGVDIGFDIASFIAMSAAHSGGSELLEPIYLRNSRYTGIG